MESDTLLDDQHESRALSAVSAESSCPDSQPGVVVRFVRSLFGYRKTSLTALTLISLVVAITLSFLDNSLDWSIQIDPRDDAEASSFAGAWADLQLIGLHRHPYNSRENDAVHDYIEHQVRSLVSNLSFMDYDNDLNYTNKILAVTPRSSNGATYYESNNVLVRVNGTHPKLPALLLSAHFDSVPLSKGVTDDGMGIASMLGALRKLTTEGKQPRRTIIFNFNNHEEFGLDGAMAFFSHPWSELVGYFLNLEGTGAGGKAIMFRGTDYGIVKEFNAVRYPYAHSMFQEAMSHGLIRSETDYKVYKEKGHWRGLDLAFYKPRSLYHTPRDNIQSISKKSLWHMFTNTVDFMESVTLQELDIDSKSPKKALDEVASFLSFFNFFFSAPSSMITTAALVVLVVVPLLSILLMVVIFRYRKNWQVGIYNFVKFPIAFVSSYLVVSTLACHIVWMLNPLLANAYYEVLVAFYASTFILCLYLILNVLNTVFKGCKSPHHDEKLIVSIQVSFLYWALSIAWVVGILRSENSQDLSGEFPIFLLFVLLTPGCFIGLFGWCLKKGSLKHLDSDEAQPLLQSDNDRRSEVHASNYGSDHDQSSRSSTNSEFSHDSSTALPLEKSWGYDWLIQFVAVVPLSLILIYHAGYLATDSLGNTVQEASFLLGVESRNIQLFAISMCLPLAPFVFKFNRFLVFLLLGTLGVSMLSISFLPAFNVANPLKLRFVQTIDLNQLSPYSNVDVFGAAQHSFAGLLEDLPSVKESKERVKCHKLTDETQKCSYKSTLPPRLALLEHSFDDLIQITVLKNTSSNVDFPFGLVSGEFKITAPENRMCLLRFNVSEDTSRIAQATSDTGIVKLVTVFDHSANGSIAERSTFALSGKAHHNDTTVKFSLRHPSGIDVLDLSRLSFSGIYHIGLDWTPSVVNAHETDANKLRLRNLGVSVECYWSEIAPFADELGNVFDRVPAFTEVDEYTPNDVTWANYGRGVVAVSRYFEL